MVTFRLEIYRNTLPVIFFIIFQAITDTSASLAGNQPFLRLLNFLCDYTGLSLTQIKEAPLFGNTYKYAMYEAQYDEGTFWLLAKRLG